MGDWFRIVVDTEASPLEAPTLARTVIDSMKERGLIVAKRTDCVLNDRGGYAPGKNAVDVLATYTSIHTPGVPTPVEKLARDLWAGRINGVEEVVGRTVFHNFGAGVDVFRCPLCLSNEVESAWCKTVGAWANGDDAAPYQCGNCHESSPLTDWIIDPPWAFGNLGFRFWNWPPLKRAFIDELATLMGHKLAMVVGKV